MLRMESVTKDYAHRGKNVKALDENTPPSTALTNTAQVACGTSTEISKDSAVMVLWRTPTTFAAAVAET